MFKHLSLKLYSLLFSSEETALAFEEICTAWAHHQKKCDRVKVINLQYVESSPMPWGAKHSPDLWRLHWATQAKTPLVSLKSVIFQIMNLKGPNLYCHFMHLDWLDCYVIKHFNVSLQNKYKYNLLFTCYMLYKTSMMMFKLGSKILHGKR